MAIQFLFKVTDKRQTDDSLSDKIQKVTVECLSQDERNEEIASFKKSQLDIQLDNTTR